MLRPEQARFVGGGGLNVAIAASWYGCSVALFCNQSAATDLMKGGEYGWLIHDEFGTRCDLRFLYTYDGVGRLIACETEASRDRYTVDVPNWKFRHVHVCCRKPLEVRSLLARLCGTGRSISVDYVVSSIGEQLEHSRRFLSAVEIMFLGAPEFAVVREHLEWQLVPYVVVTDGERPVTVYQRGDRLAHYAVDATDDVRDVTGAGDAFTGAFLATYLGGGRISGALRAGMECARKAIAVYGVAGKRVID